MIRRICFTWLILLGPLTTFFSYAIPTKPSNSTHDLLTEIAYQGKASTPHRYWLVEEKSPRSSVFKLNFEDGKKRIRTRTISRVQAEFILNQSTQIVWENQYLSTKQKIPRCTPYAFLSTAGEKSKVCVENKKAAAQSFGLFNAVRGMFR